MFNHFPKTVNGFYKFKAIYPIVCASNGRCGVILITQNNINSMDSLNKAYIETVGISDECNLVVNKFEDMYLKELSENCDSLSYPVPDILNIILNAPNIEDKIKNEIDDKMTLYIVDSQPGVFIKKKNLSTGNGLPKKWRNGYSRGIAITQDGDIAIYWLEIW